MTTFILLLLAAAVLALLEYYWAKYGLKALHFRGQADKSLVEPGETVTWSATVENRSRIPIPFVRLVMRFPGHAQLMGHKPQTALRGRLIPSFYVDEKLSLRPRQSASRQVQFSFSKRGYYSFGDYTLTCGDLLGFRESAKRGQGTSIVVIPELSRQQASIDALGGFLGDISVRRFILEDPILTIGFRDYTGREPMRAISWTRSATAGSLQVKQFDHTAEQHVVVILNLEGASGPVLEECLRLARTVCEKLEQKKMPYGFRTNGNLPGPVGKIFYMAEGLGERHKNTIFYGLGQADQTCFYSFRYLCQRTLQHRSSNESYIVITPPLEGSALAALRKLENAVGNSLCILSPKMEQEAQDVC